MNLRLLSQCETLPKIFKIQLQHHSSIDVISVICMLKKKLLKSCYKALDWWVYGLDRMASSADDWRSKSVNRSSSKVDHRALAHFVPPWIFDQLSWHNQLQYLMINRSWWQIIFWARLLPSPFLRHSFVFSFIRFNSDEKKDYQANFKAIFSH